MTGKDTVPKISNPDNRQPRPGRFVDGVWLSVAARPARPSLVPGLFLDRDGTIVKLVDYLHRVEDVRLLPGAGALVRAANAKSVPVAVTTNQAGLVRGYFGWPQYHAVAWEIDKKMAAAGAHLDGVAACPHHPDFSPDWDETQARWRKPRPGMIEELARRLALDLARSWAIGDNVIDIESARAAGLAGAIHIRTGHGARFRDAALELADQSFALEPAEDLLEAMAILKRVGCLRE